MLDGREMAERRRVMRKYVRGSFDAADDDDEAVVARERHCRRVEEEAPARREAENMADEERR